MRRVFQFDGTDGGVLSLAESSTAAKVIICVHNGDTEAQVALSREDFFELAGLRFAINFPKEENTETPELKAA